jgi:hypothetical protein
MEERKYSGRKKGKTMYFFQCKESGSVGWFGGRGKRSNRR